MNDDLKAIAPRPAANKRSPNRKPRTRMQRLRINQSWEQPHVKSAFLRYYNACGNVQIACERIARSPHTIEAWTKRDPEFKAKRIAIRDAWRSLLDESFKSMGEAALEEVKAILVNPETDAKDKIRVAMWILKAQGVGIEQTAPTTVQHSGPGGGAIPITAIVAHVKGPSVVSEEIEGEVVEQENGGESLMLAPATAEVKEEFEPEEGYDE